MTTERPMDKYQRVKKTRMAEDPIGENEIRITQQGNIRKYTSYAQNLFSEKNERTIILRAMGNAISKSISVVEMLKRKVPDLHQIVEISSVEIVDEYEPLEEGLDIVTVPRTLPCINITLSMDKLDETNPGYQAPGPFQEAIADNDNGESAVFRGRSRGRGRGRGGRGRGRDSGRENATSASKKNEDHETEPSSVEDGSEATVEAAALTASRSGRGRGRGRGSRGRSRGFRGRGEKKQENGHENENTAGDQA